MSACGGGAAHRRVPPCARMRWMAVRRTTARTLPLATALVAAGGALAHPPLVVTYHRVEAHAMITYATNAARLVDQVQRLQALGYRFVTASELARTLAADGGHGLAALTFDDGDATVLRALPFLETLGVPATVFVIGARIGTPGALSAGDLRTLVAAGWEVGSHGATHAPLTDQTPASLARELDAAIAAIRAAVDVEPACIAYPFGLHDARVRAATSTRHTWAFTTGPGHPSPDDDPLALPRPPSSSLDGADLTWRVDEDGNGLTLALTGAAMAWVVAPAPATATSPPRAAWTPTASRRVGDGAYEIDAHDGTLTQTLTLRDGPWALHALRARGARPAGALALARALPGATVAFAWSAVDGWGVGAAIDLAGRGEAWAWWTRGTGWRLGGDAILTDVLRVRGAWRPSDGALDAELRAALPLWTGEGRPVALLVGVRGDGAEVAPYLGVAVRIGPHEGAARLDTRGRVGAALAIRW